MRVDQLNREKNREKSVCKEENLQELWPILMAKRAEIYHWFAAIFALELTKEQIIAYQQGAISPLLSFLNESGFTRESKAVQSAIEQWDALGDIETIQLELAADFASLFLLDGQHAALPYASYYLEEDGDLFGDLEGAMKQLLADNQLMVDKAFNEPADHLAIILMVLARWSETDRSERNSKTLLNDQKTLVERITAQMQYIDDALLSWLPQFIARGGNIVVKSTFYSAVMKLLFAYLEADRQFLEEMGEGE